MPFDALTYKITAKELNSIISGGRIERIGMPSKDDVIVSVRPFSGKEKRDSLVLLLSVNPSRPRVHLTTEVPENPLSAYSFLMHLRKHIGGGTIESVTAVPYERIIKFTVLASDELGYKKSYALYAELLGRYSNLILTSDDGVITDCIKHIGFDVFSERALLPGIKYTLPPAPPNKAAPDDARAVINKLKEFSGGKLSEHMMGGMYGYAPATMRQIVYDAYGTLTPDADEVTAHPEKFLDAVKAVDEADEPCASVSGDKITDCFVKPYTHLDCKFQPFPSFNAAADEYFRVSAENNYVAGKCVHLKSVVKTAIKKNAKSLALLRERILESSDYEDDRIKGELLTANLYKLKQGMKEAILDDYYTGKKRTIPLDGQLSPQKNAQKFYKSYNKKKTAIVKSEEQAKVTEERMDYLESLLFALSNAENESDIAEITAEMESAGLIKRVGNKKRNKPSLPVTLQVDGFTVLIGKNNIQNDTLVRSSDGGWLWLHAQKIHGSHGVIRGTDIPQETINKVAAFVAHYSKASMSANVPVDYTLIKYVKKPSGSPPGKVIYTHQQTVNVSPVKP